ncbi:MAG: hypothetical protein SVU88_00625 [Candidatus Nanohaloarchaea archaeon]|nr:hypothetical protein [Candidatus Nanohaloarchaea archaeon]
MQRSGIMHTVEAILAAILFMFFIITVTPAPAPDTADGEVDRRVRNTLEVLDLNNSLRRPATNRSLGIVKNRVDRQITARSTAVSGLFLNTTSGRATFSDRHDDLFPVNASTVERAVLRVWYEDAASPNVTVNGNTVAALTGTVDRYGQYDILDLTEDRTNTLNITVAATSTVGYSVDVYEREQEGSAPSDTDVLTTSYVISGDNGTFTPVEVSVLSWR